MPNEEQDDDDGEWSVEPVHGRSCRDEYRIDMTIEPWDDRTGFCWEVAVIGIRHLRVGHSEGPDQTAEGSAETWAMAAAQCADAVAAFERDGAMSRKAGGASALSKKG